MLAYLDSLIAAVTVRDASDIDRLLAHPLSRILPPEARREAETFRDVQCDGLAAPLRVMQLRHQTAELLRATQGSQHAASAAASHVTISPPSRSRAQGQAQMELALSA